MSNLLLALLQQAGVPVDVGDMEPRCTAGMMIRTFIMKE